MIKLKRAYDLAARSDGHRVLIDRLWPRGMRKESLPLGRWAKEVAPSPELRKWFGHEPRKWAEFKRRYRNELEQRSAAECLHGLAARAAHGTVTLIFSSHDTEHNNAVVLKEELEHLIQRGKAKTAHPSLEP